jgi:cell division protein FtsQ
MIATRLLDRLQRLRSPRGAQVRPRDRTRIRSRRTLPRVRGLTIVILIALPLLLGGGWLWVRDSSLVAVQQVRVTGLSGPDAQQIRLALTSAAHKMTTLDVQMEQLRAAVRPYPIVKHIRVTTQFPHGMRIHAVEQVPVGAVVVSGQAIAVAGDGTLLRNVASPTLLPSIPMSAAPTGERLRDADALAAVELLAAAPRQMLARVNQVATVAQHGLVVQLRDGPSIYFGAPDRLAAKWLSATAVLADPGSAGALYIDVTVPDHPAAGAGSAPSTVAGPITPTATTAGASTTPVGG